MATSRTGTGKWKNLVKQRRHIAQTAGQTHCPECSTLLNWDLGRTPNSAEVDHIQPVMHGGEDTLDNTRIICRRCNQSLGARQWLNQKKKEVDAASTLIQTSTLTDRGQPPPPPVPSLPRCIATSLPHVFSTKEVGWVTISLGSRNSSGGNKVATFVQYPPII